VSRQTNSNIKALVSFGRIEAFLEREEVAAPPPALASTHKGSPIPVGAIRLVDASFRWGSAMGSRPLTLTNLNLNIAPGSLVCIYRPTGCGKTSLLMAMLGEVHCVTGSAAIQGRVAYVAQKSWMRHMPIRDNILFGHTYDAQHYRQVREGRRPWDAWHSPNMRARGIDRHSTLLWQAY
jgi:ABC-type multidrug transport system fused ATPase/permease subunit